MNLSSIIGEQFNFEASMALLPIRAKYVGLLASSQAHIFAIRSTIGVDRLSKVRAINQVVINLLTSIGVFG